jgi:hypothetical protein
MSACFAFVTRCTGSASILLTHIHDSELNPQSQFETALVSVKPTEHLFSADIHVPSDCKFDDLRLTPSSPGAFERTDRGHVVDQLLHKLSDWLLKGKLYTHSMRRLLTLLWFPSSPLHSSPTPSLPSLSLPRLAAKHPPHSAQLSERTTSLQR